MGLRACGCRGHRCQMAWLNMGLASIATAKEMAQIADHRKTRKRWRIVQLSGVFGGSCQFNCGCGSECAARALKGVPAEAVAPCAAATAAGRRARKGFQQAAVVAGIRVRVEAFCGNDSMHLVSPSCDFGSLWGARTLTGSISIGFAAFPCGSSLWPHVGRVCTLRMCFAHALCGLSAGLHRCEQRVGNGFAAAGSP